MKKLLFSTFITCIGLGANAQLTGAGSADLQITPETPTQKEWRVPGVVAVGKEEPRSYFMTYGNREVALANKYEDSRWYISLNGEWKFKYYDDYRSAPTSEFYSPSYSVRDWGTIKVPGNWERQGFGTPIYTNHPYEFAPVNPQPPALPDAIPVGLYRTEFEATLNMRDRDVFLCFDGVKGATTVYINGKKVGYTEDSKSRAEFLIDDYIVEGTNTLAVEVMRWGTGNYLECQDFWRISGIERDVFVWSQPTTRIDDYKVVATLDSTYTDGIFELEMALKNTFVKPSGNLQVWYELLNDAGELVDYSYAEKVMPGNSLDTVRFNRVFKNVKKWSAEEPNLYTLVLKIKQDGRFIEYATAKVGFRTSEVIGNDYLVNGKRVLLKGVNYHEHDEVTGHYLTAETMEEDMRLMKEANINAIRLAHYPQGRRFYELADKYGFYLVNEANIESHGMYYDLRKGGSLGNNPEWLRAHMERTENMYEQSKNHPSVVIWSLGNEAGNGYNFYKTYEYLKNIDTLRPVQYERALLEWNTDIYCPQYPAPRHFKAWEEAETDRPYIPSEYLHSMGNSSGGLREMWDVIYDSENLQGGFIWDWVDQGFLEYNKDSTDFTWTYGGDYLMPDGSPAPSDGNFLCNGIVSPDRTPKPALMSEIKKVYQYVHFKAVDIEKGLFEVTNYYDFNSLDKYKVTWTLKTASKTVSSGTLKIELAPQETKQVTINNLMPKRRAAGEEYFVDFSVTLLANDGLLKKGYEVASEQFLLPGTVAKNQFKASGTLTTKQDGQSIDVSSSYFSLSVDKKTGFLNSYDVNGKQMIADEIGLRPLFWRAATDNDYGSGMPRKTADFRGVSTSLSAKSVTVAEQDNGTVLITAGYDLPASTSLKITYTIYGNGVVHVGYNFTGVSGSEQLIPRLGMRMRLPKEYATLDYFGRGPQENYSDRKWGTDVGYYNSSADVQAFDYVRPQETGHHTDTRYLSLTTARTGGLAVIADNTMEFNALRNSVEDFDGEGEIAQQFDYQWNNRSKDEVQDQAAAFGVKPRHTHSWDINPRDYVELCLDYKQMGVGGVDSWYSMPYDEHLVKADQDVQWGFTLVPIRNAREAHKAATFKY